MPSRPGGWLALTPDLLSFDAGLVGATLSVREARTVEGQRAWQRSDLSGSYSRDIWVHVQLHYSSTRGVHMLLPVECHGCIHLAPYTADTAR